MRALALVAYSVGLVIELWGALLVIGQARRVQRRRQADPAIEPGSVADHLTRYRDVGRLRGDLEGIRSEQADQVPSNLAVGLLLGGIVFGYAGNFLSIAA